MDASVLWIDGVGPMTLVAPCSVGEVGDVVRRAGTDGQALYPLGGQTMLTYGLPPARPGIAVDLRGLDQVIDYPARDMTITVQAGIPLTRLQALLQVENQRLPIDVPHADLATLGGALAANTSGPRRYGLGTLRDYVIGFSAVNDDGQEIKAGGRVVKNVAGYDLCKLYIGSLGTLGIITQVTLKLKPRPEEQALLVLGCQEEALDTLLEQLHRSQTRPVCLDLLNQPAAHYANQEGGAALPDAPWVMIVGFEENREAVGWQVQQLIKEVPPGLVQGVDARVGSTAEPLWHALVEFPSWPDASLTFKANLLPHTITAFCRQAAGQPGQLLLQAHAGSGIVIGHAGSDWTVDQARRTLAELQASASAGQGNVVVLHCPSAWKTVLPIWGAPRGDAWLMRAVKEKLDPRRLFNPGRFVDGI